MSQRFPFTCAAALVFSSCGGKVTGLPILAGEPSGSETEAGPSSMNTVSSGASAGSGSFEGTGQSTASGASTGTAEGPDGMNGVMVQSDADTSTRCGFMSGVATSPVTSPAPESVVAARIFLFLTDSSTLPHDLSSVSPVTADWAANLATGILDSDFTNGSAPAGLVRFLTAWLGIPVPDAGLVAAQTWAANLADPTATLTTLLAGPTSDPHRIGILTDPQFLTAFGFASDRGVWMEQNLFCTLIPPPPPGIPPPTMTPGMTYRQWLESDVAAAECTACHELIDPPGFSLEHFDDLGNYRDTDNGQPVDSSGTIASRMLSFTSIGDLAPQLATSCPVARCFANALMSDASAQFASTSAFTAGDVDEVASAFANSNFSIRALVKSIVGTSLFLQ